MLGSEKRVLFCFVVFVFVLRQEDRDVLSWDAFPPRLSPNPRASLNVFLFLCGNKW